MKVYHLRMSSRRAVIDRIFSIDILIENYHDISVDNTFFILTNLKCSQTSLFLLTETQSQHYQALLSHFDMLCD